MCIRCKVFHPNDLCFCSAAKTGKPRICPGLFVLYIQYSEMKVIIRQMDPIDSMWDECVGGLTDKKYGVGWDGFT